MTNAEITTDVPTLLFDGDAPVPRVHTGDGLLNLDVHQDLKLHINQMVGEDTAVLGVKGSGKSFTSRVTAEEMLRFIAMTIVDIDGEYHTLNELHPSVRVFGGDYGELLPEATSLAEHSYRLEIPVVLDFTNHPDEMMDYLIAYFDTLWRLSTRLTARKPYGLLIEEAHEFIPQRQSSPIKKSFLRLAGRGRKRGFTPIYVSQRSQKVDKDVLTGCTYRFLHRVIDPHDLATYAELVPRPAKQVYDTVLKMQTGDVLVRYGDHVQMVHTRLAHTTHKGNTPKLVFQPTLLLRDTQPALLDLIESASVSEAPSAPAEEIPLIEPTAALVREVLFMSYGEVISREEAERRSALLGCTVREWGERLYIAEQTVESDDLVCVTVIYEEGAITYHHRVLSTDEVITPTMAASALWAITATCWNHRTVESFCASLGADKENPVYLPTDPLIIAWFEDWRTVGRACLKLFGETFGNEKRLYREAEERITP